MMRSNEDPRAALQAARIADAFAAWLRGAGEELTAAADLLGGPDWAARAEELIQDVAEGRHPAERLADLRALLRLLRLDAAEVHLMGEAYCGIDLDDVRAEAIQRCAEALDRGVAALDATGGMSPRPIREIA